MIDHVTIPVRDYARSKAFYEEALAPLGYQFAMEFESWGGFADEHGPSFWLNGQPPAHAPIHVAFHAKDRATVDAFHGAALAAGGTDNGKPGLRPEYHPDYYGAFVLDPDGHNVEAVCHRPATAAAQTDIGG
jgi:catechol 2,3-dioxygenase-like lactoylglutathione lyase family enzyme